MHILDIRADKMIGSREDLIDVVDRYKADKTQFDVVNWDSGYKFIKAVREYDVLVKSLVNFEVIVFEYEGKTYRTRTRKYFSVKMKITKNGGKVIEHTTEQVECLISDATNEVIGEEKLIRTLDTFKLQQLY
jgi:hypothetical protein